MPNLDLLREHLTGLGRVLLGYSGGIDSALLAVVCTRTLGPERFLAVTGRSASLAEDQAESALSIAREFAIPLREIATNELNDRRYLSNPTNRCYFCKAELWSRLRTLADELGFDTIIDGTNADDLGEHRPGMRAGQEYRIQSPLADLGWTKHEIRVAARELGLSIWDAPAAPCLSSRVVYGLAITPERLHQVEEGERLLRSLGVGGDLRVRHHGVKARIEVVADQMDRVRAHWVTISRRFAELGFDSVELDPAGYRRGGLLAVAQLPA